MPTLLLYKNDVPRCSACGKNQPAGVSEEWIWRHGAVRCFRCGGQFFTLLKTLPPRSRARAYGRAYYHEVAKHKKRRKGRCWVCGVWFPTRTCAQADRVIARKPVYCGQEHAGIAAAILQHGRSRPARVWNIEEMAKQYAYANIGVARVRRIVQANTVRVAS